MFEIALINPHWYMVKGNLDDLWLPIPSGLPSMGCDLVDAELLSLMKKAGCWMISCGVESGNDDLLDTIHKVISREKIESACGSYSAECYHENWETKKTRNKW